MGNLVYFNRVFDPLISYLGESLQYALNEIFNSYLDTLHEYDMSDLELIETAALYEVVF